MLALTRAVSPAIGRCELSHLQRTSIDPAAAARQHDLYRAALQDLGCTIVEIPAADDLPDSVFVEDTAVVLDEVAIVARPGAQSRRPETQAVAEALMELRPLRRIEAPGTLDGGDVLRVHRTLWVGQSERTNAAGFGQLSAIAEPLGYEVQQVPVRGCLHLKTAISAAVDGSLLVNPEWVDTTPFARFELVEVHPDEPFAANILAVRGSVIMPAGQPRTRERLRARGVRVVEVDLSELAKAEAGVTCCSILVSP